MQASKKRFRAYLGFWQLNSYVDSIGATVCYFWASQLNTLGKCDMFALNWPPCHQILISFKILLTGCWGSAGYHWSVTCHGTGAKNHHINCLPQLKSTLAGRAMDTTTNTTKTHHWLGVRVLIIVCIVLFCQFLDCTWLCSICQRRCSSNNNGCSEKGQNVCAARASATHLSLDLRREVVLNTIIADVQLIPIYSSVRVLSPCWGTVSNDIGSREEDFS